MSDEQGKDRHMKEIERRLAEQMRGKPSDDDGDHGFDSNSENAQKLDHISKKIWMERMEDKENARLAAEEEKMAYENAVYEQEITDRDAELEYERGKLSGVEDLEERLERKFPKEWKRMNEDKAFEAKINRHITLEIAESGGDGMREEPYLRVFSQFAHRREEEAEFGEEYVERKYRDEDQRADIRHNRLEEIRQNNIIWNSQLRSDEPATPEQVINQANIDFPEQMNDPRQKADAVESVNRRIAKGEPHDQYSTYQGGALDAARREAIRTMAKERGFDPDEI